MSSFAYQLVTDLILQKLARGTVPWKRPWNGAMPQNISGHEYTGANRFLLQKDYQSPFWLTFRQTTERGGHIRKGEKASQVIFWKMLQVPEDGSDGSETKTVPYLKFYRVWNLEQTSNVKLDPKTLETIAKLGKKEEFDAIGAAEEIWDGFNNRPDLRYGNRGACYDLTTDRIHLPHKWTFLSAAGYYETLFHEAAHSTGHATRLDRRIGASFGSADYSREELTAELCASILLARAGLDIEAMTDNSAAYCQSWMQVLGEDPRCFVQAAAAAERAADFVLGIKREAKSQRQDECA